MEQNRAQSTAIPRCSSQPNPWLSAASGMLALTVGLQGATANNDATVTLSETENPTDQSEDNVDVSAPVETTPVLPAPIWPRFSKLIQTRQPVKTETRPLAMTRLESHQRELHRRSNDVESQLLAIQELLSLPSYGTSFADRLLDDDDVYQTKLQQLRLLEAEIHTALERSDETTVNQLKTRLQRADRELRRLAQKQLRRYIEQAQATSTLGLWQEPMYQESLRWLMEHTHERHLLKARQQTLRRTMIATASDWFSAQPDR
ncbi:MAG: hypothetical protein AAGI69_00820 [Cyanobacteria bacterium P01_H01_bin.21]